MIAPSRRTFLRTLLSLPIAATVDVEQLLWTPSPMIVVPAYPPLTIAEINAVIMQSILPGLRDQFFLTSPLVEYMRAHERAKRASERRLGMRLR